MIKVSSIHRKRPHLLPPLRDSSLLRSMDPLQPPDLLLTKNRLGSPIPRPSDPREFDYVCNESDDNPMIRINEPCQNESEGNELIKFDLLSDPVLGKTNNLLHHIQKETPLTMPGLESEREKGGRENSLFRNLSKKKFEKPTTDDLKFQAVLPLEGHEDTKTFEPKFFQIPNRYTLLKPIGEGNLKTDS